MKLSNLGICINTQEIDKLAERAYRINLGMREGIGSSRFAVHPLPVGKSGKPRKQYGILCGYTGMNEFTAKYGARSIK